MFALAAQYSRPDACHSSVIFDSLSLSSTLCHLGSLQLNGFSPF
jgi:hypothetical protein